MVDYKNFIAWALIKEPSLKIEPEEVLEGEQADTTEWAKYQISEYSYNQLYYAFRDAYARVSSLRAYMNTVNFENLVFNYALHLSIAHSIYIQKRRGDGSVVESDVPEESLQKLYLTYGLDRLTAGIVTSVSSANSSSSSTLPKSITEGDLETSFLINTPYGYQAEIILESIKGAAL